MERLLPPTPLAAGEAMAIDNDDVGTGSNAGVPPSTPSQPIARYDAMMRYFGDCLASTVGIISCAKLTEILSHMGRDQPDAVHRISTALQTSLETRVRREVDSILAKYGARQKLDDIDRKLAEARHLKLTCDQSKLVDLSLDARAAARNIYHSIVAARLKALLHKRMELEALVNDDIARFTALVEQEAALRAQHESSSRPMLLCASVFQARAGAS